MNENGTVQQLSKALNQLLDAYETLQEEAKNLKEENTTLKEEIDDLELRNRGLDSRLCALNDTTKHTSSEMDTMLGRIETILGPTAVEEEKEEEKVEPEPEVVEKEEEKEDNNFYQNQDENKEIDLGRMQSLLNGFSN